MILVLGRKRGPFFDEVLKSLGWVGDPVCQAALVEILNHYRSDPAAAVKVMLAMAFVKAPAPKAQAALERLAENAERPGLSASAKLLLGQMAFQLRDAEPERAAAIEERFNRELSEASDSRSASRLGQALDRIGNAGLCTEYVRLERLAQSPEDAVAARALEALRFCRDPRVAEQYLNGLRAREALRTTILGSLEMRAQRGMYDEAIFAGLLSWFTEVGARTEAKKQSVAILGQLARLDAGAQARFEALRRDCERYQVCGD